MKRFVLSALGLAAAGAFLAGCTTFHENQPGKTATEELIVSHAAELAADKIASIASAVPAGQRAFVDDTHFKGDNADYGVSAIRGALLKRGLILAAGKADSDITIEIRMGAMSIDMRDTLFGLPPLAVPLPGTLTAFATPELSIYSRTQRTGAAEFAAFAYDSKTGRPIAFVGPLGGERLIDQKTYLTVFTTGPRDEQPTWTDAKAKEKDSR
jgi:hypothetical protein